MKRAIQLGVACVVVLVATAGQVQAGLITFTANPTTNSSDFDSFVSGLGGTINTNVNFDTHPTGQLIPNFYLASEGVTLTPIGDVNLVQFGQGPGQSNTTNSSSGEGLNPASNFLLDGAQPSSLIISFDAPVLGAGLFVIDYFNPKANNPLELEAFTGPNGTGISLGIATSVALNFQRNFLYFMGVASTENNIRSVVFRDVNANTGDIIGLDNIRFAQQSSVPEPTSLALLGIGACVAGVAAAARRRREKQQAAAA